jgi:hypothetical protein
VERNIVDNEGVALLATESAGGPALPMGLDAIAAAAPHADVALEIATQHIPIGTKLSAILGKDQALIDLVMRLYFAMHVADELLHDVLYMLDRGCECVAALMWVFVEAPGPCETEEAFEQALREGDWIGELERLSDLREVAHRAQLCSDNREALVLRALLEVKRDGYLERVHPNASNETLWSVM